MARGCGFGSIVTQTSIALTATTPNSSIPLSEVKGGPRIVRADAKTEAMVIAVVNQFIEAFTKQDLDGILALFAPDPDVVFIGTGIDEKCIGLVEIKAVLERDFAQSEGASMQLGWYSVSMAGSVAWAASDCVVWAKIGGQEISFPIRVTIVLEQRGGSWLIAQVHASLPAAGQKEGEGWPTGSS